MLNISQEVTDYRAQHCADIPAPDGHGYREIGGVYVFDTPEETDHAFVDEMEAVLKDADPGEGTIWSTGGSFHGPCDIIGDRRAALSSILQDLILMNQDELCGIDEDDPRSYRHYMRTRLRRHFPELLEEKWVIPNPELDPDEALAIFTQQLEMVERVKLAMLGIGPDANPGAGLEASSHIGFIMPNTPLSKMAEIVDLDDATRFVNSGGHPETYPRQSITHGPKNVLRTEHILNLAKGPHKQRNIERTVLGGFDPAIPSTLVHLTSRPLSGDTVKFFMDRQAATQILKKLRA